MPLTLTLKGMFPPAGTTPNQRVPPDGGGVWGGAVRGAFTPGITPPPPAITAPPAGASEPPPAIAPDEPLAAASDPPPAAAPATPAAPPVAAAAPPASALDAAARPQAMAAPTGLYSPRRIRRAVMGIVAMRRAKMMLARLSSSVPSTPRRRSPEVALTHRTD